MSTAMNTFPRVTTLRDGRHRILFPDGTREFLSGANKAWAFLYPGVNDRWPILSKLKRLSPPKYRERKTEYWMSERITWSEDAGFNMIAKNWRGFWDDPSLQPQPYDPSFGWWTSLAPYAIAERWGIPHMVLVNVYPETYVFENEDYPIEEKRRQQFPDVWSGWWKLQVETTMRQAAMALRYHQFLVGVLLGNEPPFVIEGGGPRSTNPGAWHTQNWALAL